MIIDVLIAASVLGAAYLGFRRGFIQPLVAEILFIAVILILWADRDGYGRVITAGLHGNAVLAVGLALALAAAAAYAGSRVGGFIHRMPAIRGVDSLLGIAVQTGFAVLVCYLGVAALIAMDRAFSLTAGRAALTLAQIQAVQRELATSPLTRGLAPPAEIARLETEATRASGAQLSGAPGLDRALTVYQDVLEPQLAESRLAPVVLAVGHRVGGGLGPTDLPRPGPGGA